MATGFPVKANYATGDVLTAANMNDLSGTLNYLQYLPPRNPILNSAMNVWQRGTSVAVSGASALTFAADRWGYFRGGYVTGMTVSRQATGDTTNLPFIQYAARVQRDSGNTSTQAIYFGQNIETVNSIPFAGKTITYSFYARAGANYSSGSSGLTVNVLSGTGTDQSFIAALTGSANVISQNITLTTTWQRFTITSSAAVSSSATQLVTYFNYTPVGTAGAADYFEITGVQLELGSSANTYMPNQPTYQAELAACQRYYYRAGAGNVYGNYSSGIAYSTTNAYSPIKLPVTMRTIPATLDYSTLALFDGVTFTAVSSMTLSSNQNTPDTALLIPAVASGLTQYRPYFLVNNNNTAGYVGLSAEL